MRYVIKIGGSVMHMGREILRVLEDLNKDMLIVPGGGLFSDLVKVVYDIYNVSDDSAHWMSILAMDQYAYFLASDKYRLTDIPEFSKEITILMPYNLMKKEDPLPRSWNVTSDAIAAWIAGEHNGMMIKVTDVDGVEINGIFKKEIHASELRGIPSCIDPATPDVLMEYGTDCFVVNGNHPERVKGYILGDEVIGTLIKGGDK